MLKDPPAIASAKHRGGYVSDGPRLTSLERFARRSQASPEIIDIQSWVLIRPFSENVGPRNSREMAILPTKKADV